MAATTTVEVIQLEPELAQRFWPELVPFVLRALEFDPYESVTVGELLQQVQAGYARVLIAVDEGQLLSATVVQLFKATTGERVLHVVTTAGENSNVWLPALIEKFAEISKAEGCAKVTMTGRPGWAKKINKFGFKVARVTMEMEVDNGRIFEQQITK